MNSSSDPAPSPPSPDSNPPSPPSPDPNPPSPPSPSPTQAPSGGLSATANLWATVIASIVALAAFLLSIYNTLQAERAPNVTMTMPQIVLIKTLDESRQNQVALKATFTIDRGSSRTAIVRSILLDLTPPPGYSGPPPKPILIYHGKSDEFGSVSFNEEAGPIVVTQDQPASPILVFRLGPSGLTAGKWQMVITAAQADGTTLRTDSCLSLSNETIEFLKRDSNTRSLNKDYVQTINGVLPQAELDPTCYRG